MNNLSFMVLMVLITYSSCISQVNYPSKSSDKHLLTDEYRSQWKGSPDHWRWEEDVLIGETTEVNPIEHNSFLIWDQDVEDFILKISFRISDQGNSGIYYRCERGPEGYDELLGYQADIDGQHTYTGIVYENFLNRHRKILAGRGQFVRISDVDSVQDFSIVSEDDIKGELIKDGGWNEYELIVQKTLIVQKLNGRVVSMVEDLAKDRLKKGLFGFQLHRGPPMKVEFRDAVFRDLSQ